MKSLITLGVGALVGWIQCGLLPDITVCLSYQKQLQCVEVQTMLCLHLRLRGNGECSVCL